MKLRLTALSINSMDMKTVITLRRKRKPATPSTNKMALSIRYQEMGTEGGRAGSGGKLFDLLSRQDNRADDRNQNQNAGHLKGKQVSSEERPAYLNRSAFG